MPRVDLTLESRVERTARVVQMEGMFDVPASDKTRVEFHFDAPLDERPWNVGLIVGPSGAGKSSVARHLFGPDMVSGYEWPSTRSIVDGFGDMPIRETTAALSSVGFSSPPNWLRPFAVLSNGEQFRATMARALVDPRPLICIDEFTSVVDRTVAQIGSHAIAKSIRSRGKKLVAVTCHYDIEEWLQPDWVIEPHLGRFAWRSLQRRPPIGLEIRRVHSSAWNVFAHHHYLSADINPSAASFVAFWHGTPVAFDSWLPHFGRHNGPLRRGHKSVCLPDYQGVGIGNALIDTIASMWRGLGYRAVDSCAHPGIIRYRAKSSKWRLTQPPKFHRPGGKGVNTTHKDAAKRVSASHAVDRRIASFEYVGPAMSRKEAECLLGE